MSQYQVAIAKGIYNLLYTTSINESNISKNLICYHAIKR